MQRTEPRNVPGSEGFHRPPTLGPQFHLNTLDRERSDVRIHYSRKEGSCQHSSGGYFGRLSALGVHLLYLALASFLSWVRLPPRGTVPKQLSYFTKEKAGPLSTSWLFSLTSRQNPAFTLQCRCPSPTQQAVLRPGSHRLALAQTQATYCSVLGRTAHSLHRDTFSSSLDLLPFFFLLSSLFYLVSSSSF